MSVLRLKVICFRCNREVPNTAARKIPLLTGKPRFECFTCFKRYPLLQRASENEISKESWCCERCHYKFTSHKGVCPYCNKSDEIIKGNLTIHDLL